MQVNSVGQSPCITGVELLLKVLCHLRAVSGWVSARDDM